MQNINEILNNDDELNEDLLLKYAEGKLSEEECHAIESKMIDSPFLSDAVEGLEGFKNKKKVLQFVDELNYKLQKNTAQKKKYKAKKKLPNMDLIIIAVIIVLLLCILGYTVLHLFYTKK